ncbi:PssD/Cps14F family polysaccharide biosynthesis glycosyltransferase [Aquipuribacter sp. SD81]|uniref:PssD/Cps14F family polysaccharide biosynthesis glycosyltransferase n=1 Tax=Aquipuribacter sp. SD81 TaxID=3127703 RepID=UPI00301A0B4D
MSTVFFRHDKPGHPARHRSAASTRLQVLPGPRSDAPPAVEAAGTGEVAGTRQHATLRVLLVCSTGGHLTHLVRLSEWWSQHERSWVTFDKPDARSLLAGERTWWAYHPTTRNLVALVRNFLLAVSVLLRERPDVVVSSGAGVALPFFVVAKALGVRTVYLEVYDRITMPTLTGRLCAPLSDLFLLQWEEQRQAYPKGRVVGRLF